MNWRRCWHGGSDLPRFLFLCFAWWTLGCAEVPRPPTGTVGGTELTAYPRWVSPSVWCMMRPAWPTGDDGVSDCIRTSGTAQTRAVPSWHGGQR